MPEWLREIGSIAGLFSLAIVLVDRFLKDRPTCSISMGDYGPELAVLNSSNVDVSIIGWSVQPSAYGVAKNDQLNAVMRGAARHQFAATVKAGSEERFVLITQSVNGVKQTEIHRRGLVLLYWRRNSSMWMPQIPLWATFDVDVIKRLRPSDSDGQ